MIFLGVKLSHGSGSFGGVLSNRAMQKDSNRQLPSLEGQVYFLPFLFNPLSFFVYLQCDVSVRSTGAMFF